MLNFYGSILGQNKLAKDVKSLTSFTFVMERLAKPFCNSTSSASFTLKYSLICFLNEQYYLMDEAVSMELRL